MTILNRLASNWSRVERERLNTNWSIIENYLSNLQGQINLLTGDVNVQELIDELNRLLNDGTIILGELESALNNVTEIITDAQNATENANDATQSALNAINDIQSMIDNFHSKGIYDNDTVYYKNNSVFHEGSSYIFINNTPGKGNPPPNYPIVSNDHWQMTAAKGAAGDGAVSKVNGKEPDGAGEVTLTASDVGAASAEQLEQMKPKVDNSWQKGVYNDASITNTGFNKAERTFSITSSDWLSSTNSEVLWLRMPIQSFSGIIKVTYTSYWSNSDPSGGATVVYRIGRYGGGSTTTVNDFVIETITSKFAESYQIRPMNSVADVLAIELGKAPTGSNPMVINVELQGTSIPVKSAFSILEGTTVRFTDSGSPTGFGYPWTPQRSQIPTASEIAFWNVGMWDDIVNGRDYPINGVSTNLASLKPAQFRDFLINLLPRRTGTFKCFVNTPDVGATSINGYGVLTTIKPWVDESGGGLNQKFEAGDTIQKRFQIDDNTWSPWVTTQHKDVDVVKLFQSASDVKKNVAQAITDKGVPTSPDATGAQMAANIRKLGGRVFTGNVATPEVPNRGDVSVYSTLIDFKPTYAFSDWGGMVYIKDRYIGPTGLLTASPQGGGEMVQAIGVQQIGNQWRMQFSLTNYSSMTKPASSLNYYIFA